MLNGRTTNIRGIDGAATQNNNALVSVRPFFECQHLFKGISPNYQYVNARHELVIAMWLTTTFREKVKIAVASRDEAVKARTNKDGCPHTACLDLRSYTHIGRLLSARQISGLRSGGDALTERDHSQQVICVQPLRARDAR